MRANFLPLEDGRFLKVGGGRTKQQVAKFSARDADRLDDYQRRLDAIADVLRAMRSKRRRMSSKTARSPPSAN